MLLLLFVCILFKTVMSNSITHLSKNKYTAVINKKYIFKIIINQFTL